MDFDSNGGVWKVYASREYTPESPRTDHFVEVNLQEYMPTLPQDGNYTNVALQSGYFVNSNYPNTTGTVKSVHYMKLPLLAGTTCPVIFPKGTSFLLFTPTTKIEEGYLLYIGESDINNGAGNQNTK